MPARHDRHCNPTRWILDGKSRNKPLAMGSSLGPNIMSISHSRAIATRYDKLARNFLAGVQMAAAMILLN
jgi:transposase